MEGQSVGKASCNPQLHYRRQRQSTWRWLMPRRRFCGWHNWYKGWERPSPHTANIGNMTAVSPYSVTTKVHWTLPRRPNTTIEQNTLRYDSIFYVNMSRKEPLYLFMFP